MGQRSRAAQRGRRHRRRNRQLPDTPHRIARRRPPGCAARVGFHPGIRSTAHSILGRPWAHLRRSLPRPASARQRAVVLPGRSGWPARRGRRVSDGDGDHQAHHWARLAADWTARLLRLSFRYVGVRATSRRPRSHRTSAHERAPQGPAEVTTIPEGTTILDVREPEEFADFHLDGAINVPLGTIIDGYTPPEAAPGTIVVCARGARSAQAVAALDARGVTGTASLRGGVEQFRPLG